MKNIKVGDELTIHCYKHNSKIHRTWDDAVVLDITEDMLVCANYRTWITEADGRSHRTKEPAIIFFYKNYWYNVYAQIKKNGLFYKCNIATPFLIDGKIIKFIDYDLDLKVFPDGGFKILDRNEYKYHKKKMGYSEDLDIVVKNGLDALVELKKNNLGPFQEGVVEKYYNLYQSLINKDLKSAQ